MKKKVERKELTRKSSADPKASFDDNRTNEKEHQISDKPEELGKFYIFIYLITFSSVHFNPIIFCYLSAFEIDSI